MLADNVNVLWCEQLGTANFFSFWVMVMAEVFDAATSAGHLICQPVVVEHALAHGWHTISQPLFNLAID